jgi:hypothetical protein
MQMCRSRLQAVPMCQRFSRCCPQMFVILRIICLTIFLYWDHLATLIFDASLTWEGTILWAELNLICSVSDYWHLPRLTICIPIPPLAAPQIAVFIILIMKLWSRWDGEMFVIHGEDRNKWFGLQRRRRFQRKVPSIMSNEVLLSLSITANAIELLLAKLCS